MKIDVNNLVSISEANQNFSKVARKVDENGSVIILKNNRPKYLLVEFDKTTDYQVAPDEDVIAISKRIIKENKASYETLSKEQK
ncbi:type II toxin-antitoxin system Phd/YefM family antitoxin [uncultured Helcococcus sp.]|uniref:type II toxin-antitoxin system Phd/YefM family antitoxin n=1 Tax=uncultured Helcococcus sp. TaxID=1072508 RepID=UPI00288A7C7D|nr:type II toxin-antitoxin system Phd/YefM family antitoxin [uncultured Helcococcus sp.]